MTADRHTQCRRLQRDLGNDCRATTGCVLNRASQGLAITHQLIEIRCATGDLGDRPVTDRRSQGCYVHLVEAVAERGIGRWLLQLQAKCLGPGAVVADGETLQIPQDLAAAQDSEHGHQLQIPGWKPNPSAHLRV